MDEGWVRGGWVSDGANGVDLAGLLEHFCSSQPQLLCVMI